MSGLQDVPLKRPTAWTKEESDILLAAIETHSISTVALLKHIAEKTGRSERAVERKLLKIGYLAKAGKQTVTRRSKFGFVR